MLAKPSDQMFIVGMLALGVIVVVGSAFLVLNKRPHEAVLAATTEVASVEPTGRPALDLSEVQPGDKVHLESVELTEPGFIVVTEDQNRDQGDMLGVSSLLTAGIHQDVQVGVHSPLVDSQVVHVVLYKDDGDGVFSENDGPVTDENGLAIEVVKNVGMLPMDHAY